MDDLERFWEQIFSEDRAQIAAAWETLDPAEREAVAAHLRSIVSDPERHPDQRRAAEVALSVRQPSLRQKLGRERRGELLLASGSPRRRELIALLGLPFTITSANVSEDPHPGESPPEIAVRLSRAKVEAARQSIQPTNQPNDYPTILISADTTVSLGGEALGKPGDAGEARSMLARLRGRSHRVFTAITLIELESGRRITDLASTDVPMRDYNDAEVEAYIASGDPFDKAGGYAIQHGGFNPVSEMRGCYANVVGLPLCHVTRSLRAWGIEPPADVPAACQAHLKYDCPVYQLILAGRPVFERSARTP